MFSRKSSPLLESYGCLERTNITLFMPNSWITPLYDRLINSEDPCCSIFYYSHHSRKIVQWNGDQNQVENEKAMSTEIFSESDTMEFIESLYEKQVEKDGTTKQILLIDYSIEMKDKVSKAIESLDRETDWNVIISCLKYCPILQHFPINRIVPRNSLTKSYLKSIRDIAKNPDFNKNEFLKHIKLDNAKLACLANKTIHVFMINPSVKVLENMVQIVYNTQRLSAKIILYAHNGFWMPTVFWTHYIEKNGWKNIVNIVFERDSKPLPQQNTGEVYLIDEIMTKNPFGQKYLYHEDFCSLSRKYVTFYTFEDDYRSTLFKDVNATEWYNDIDSACRKNIEKVSFNKNYEFEEDFNENFIEEVFSASCF